MGYLQEADRWLDMLFTDLANEKISFAEVKRDIRERILQSYKNGLQASEERPAPRPNRPNRFRQRTQAA